MLCGLRSKEMNRLLAAIVQRFNCIKQRLTVSMQNDLIFELLKEKQTNEDIQRNRQNFKQKVIEHLKSFDQFDRLKITAETDLNDTSLQIMLEIDDTRRCFYTYDLPTDLFELAKDLEQTVYYLSWQTEFVKDLKELIGSSADSISYSYSFDLDTFASVRVWRPYHLFDFTLALDEDNSPGSL